VLVYLTGTGKSVTGAHLAYASIISNSPTSPPDEMARCVMYCGPSNKSVDVVLGEHGYFIQSIFEGQNFCG